MPKQLYKIDQFHGGLNSNSDPRDIADNEFSSAQDVVFNELGRVRTMGGPVAHSDMDATITGHVEAGYGLYQISHDREYVELGEHLNNTTQFNSNWTRTSDFAVDATDITYTHSIGGGSVYQTYGNRAHVGINNATYVFRYTMSNLNTPANVTTLVIDSTSGFSSADVPLIVSNGTHQIQFTSDSSATSQGFKIRCVSSGAVTFNLDDLSLHLVNNAETEDDYMIVADTDATAAISMYSKGRDSTTLSRVSYGSTAGSKPIFYNVDGVLRINDASFSNSDNKWFGYIKDNLFQSCDGNHFIHKRFYSVPQRIQKPAASYFDESELTLGQSYPATSATMFTFTDTADQDRFHTQDDIFEADDAGSPGEITNIGKIEVTITATEETEYDGDASDADIVYTLRVGPATNSSTWDEGLVKEIDYSIGGNDYSFNFEKTHTFVWAVTGSPELTIANGSTAGIRAALTTTSGTGSAVSQLQIETVKCYEASYQSASHSLLSDNNVIFELPADTPSSGTAAGWDYEWNVGATFVYDDLGIHRQESAITELADEDNSSDKIMTIANSTYAPSIKLCLKYSHNWNPRIVGINLYMKRVSKTTNEPWYLQAKYDLIQGKGQIMPSGNEVNFTFDASVGEFQCYFNNEDLLTPNLADTYTSETGVREDEKSLYSQYKTAVVANRRTYIGGLKVTYEDLTSDSKDIMSDTIIKSPVNRFDTFPLSNKIEAAVRDGDSIVALTEYADRLLEFKKRSLYIINISQDAEYLEDSHLHKGILHPGAVTKTDYGIAWVNDFGCYFYDGQKVSDLIEKGPRQIISASDWSTFVTETTIIGYIPLNKQLIVLRDCSGSSVGNIYLYDMVTQSWSIGDSKYTDSKVTTNFVNDWNGDLVLSHESSSDTITTQKWSDSATSTSTFELTTKDIDFGQPSLRKKVYKLYVTYTGGTSNNIDVAYAVDGSSSYSQFDANLDSSSATQTELALKPNASINNIKSIKIKFSGTAASTFQINDLSLVYRLKSVI